MSASSIKPFTAFIGREVELRQLHQTLITVIFNKGPQFILIQGDFEVGKTALVEHFLTEVVEKNPSVQIGQGKCAMETESNGLIPFAQLFRSLTEQSIKRRVVFGSLLEFAKDVAPDWIDIFGYIRISQPSKAE